MTRSRRVLCGLWLCASATHAHLTISPPQILPSDKGIIATEVRSNAKIPTRWQVTAANWIQRDGKNVLEPVDEFEITPRFFTLQPGESQIIRALVPHADYFRILVEQISEGQNAQGVALQFRFSLPVYRWPNEPESRNVDFIDQPCIDLINDSARAQQLTTTAAFDGPPVLLPGASAQICKKAAAKP